ncbi:ATP-binding protein [bacterium]|nr:ATP-binding protein [bacterium]
MKKNQNAPVIKTNSPQKIILTGGPCSGKTSLILALQNRGEHILKEAATDWILYQQACGNDRPWEKPDFQHHIFKLQQQQEQRIHPQAQRVFLDRGTLDCLAYLEINNPLYGEIEQKAKAHLYDYVFLIAPLNFMQTNTVRRENKQEAQQLHKKLEALYRASGYNPITIYPEKTLELRVDKVLKHIPKCSNLNPYAYKMPHHLVRDQENPESTY